MITYPIGFWKNEINNAFIFTINTALGSGTNDFTLPLPSGLNYDFTVFHGDGNSTSYVGTTPSITINYASGGVYQVSIKGKCGGWSFNNLGDKLKITSVVSWGNVEFDYIAGGFYGCTNLTSIPSSEKLPFLGNSLLDFLRTTGITTIPIGFFDLCVNVNNAQQIFLGSKITNIPDELFRYMVDVTNFSYVFAFCYDITLIGEDIFYYNSNALYYNYAFSRIRNAVVPTRLFNNAHLPAVLDFLNFMDSTTVGYSSTGTIQDIWNYATSATSTNTFLNQTALTNYASIPNGWKGL